MTSFRGVRRRTIPFLMATAVAPMAIAMTEPAAAQTGNGSAAQTLPGLDNFSLPPSQPTPTPSPTPAPVIAPLPTPTASPRPTPTPRVTPRAIPTPTPTPRVTATPTPRATASPTPAATPTAIAVPTPTPTPTPIPTPTPTATPTPVEAATPSPAATTVPATAPDSGSDYGWLIGLAVVLGLGGAGAWWWRRRRADAADEPVTPTAPAPIPKPQPFRPRTPAASPATPPAPVPAPISAPVGDRGRLSLSLHPRRAGLNLLSATVEAELVVRNDGSAPAQAIRIGAALIGATPGQGDEIAPVFDQPVVRPATPPFALGPGEERRIRLVVAQARADIVPLTAGGRTLFVPVVAVNALYDAGAGIAGQSARGFAVGVERVDSAKLAPFWLDQPARMHEQLGVRPYGAGVER